MSLTWGELRSYMARMSHMADSELVSIGVGGVGQIKHLNAAIQHEMLVVRPLPAYIGRMFNGIEHLFPTRAHETAFNMRNIKPPADPVSQTDETTQPVDSTGEQGGSEVASPNPPAGDPAPAGTEQIHDPAS